MAVTEAAVRALRLRRLIADLSKQRRRRARKIPRMSDPRAAELAYRRRLVDISKRFRELVEERLLVNLPTLVERFQMDRPDAASIRLDDAVDEIVEIIEGIKVTLGQEFTVADLTVLAGDIGSKVNAHNTTQLNRVLQSTVGIDIVASEPWLGPELAAFRRQNVGLVVDQVWGNRLQEIEQVMIRGTRTGARVEEIRDQIQKQFNVSRNKASLLARDQTNKLNGELTQLRQRALGLEKYRWRNSQDERVRGNPDGLYPNAEFDHWSREGRVYSWDKPPPDGHPGEPIQCRCWAEPVLDPLLEAE